MTNLKVMNAEDVEEVVQKTAQDDINELNTEPPPQNLQTEKKVDEEVFMRNSKDVKKITKQRKTLDEVNKRLSMKEERQLIRARRLKLKEERAAIKEREKALKAKRAPRKPRTTKPKAKPKAPQVGRSIAEPKPKAVEVVSSTAGGAKHSKKSGIEGLTPDEIRKLYGMFREAEDHHKKSVPKKEPPKPPKPQINYVNPITQNSFSHLGNPFGL